MTTVKVISVLVYYDLNTRRKLIVKIIIKTYKNEPESEFSSLSVGIIKNKLKTETLKIPPGNDGL